MPRCADLDSQPTRRQQPLIWATPPLPFTTPTPFVCPHTRRIQPSRSLTRRCLVLGPAPHSNTIRPSHVAPLRSPLFEMLSHALFRTNSLLISDLLNISSRSQLRNQATRQNGHLASSWVNPRPSTIYRPRGRPLLRLSIPTDGCCWFPAVSGLTRPTTATYCRSRGGCASC